jgi:hypothetical protein
MICIQPHRAADLAAIARIRRSARPGKPVHFGGGSSRAAIKMLVKGTKATLGGRHTAPARAVRVVLSKLPPRRGAGRDPGLRDGLGLSTVIAACRVRTPEVGRGPAKTRPGSDAVHAPPS